MTAKTTLSVESLKKLGINQLATILFDISTGDKQIAQRLKMELTAKDAPDLMVKEMRKRLRVIGNAKKKLSKSEQKQLAVHLEAQRKTIVDAIKTSDPRDCYELLLTFANISYRVKDRIDYNEEISDTFSRAFANVKEFAKLSKQQPIQLADMFVDWFKQDQERVHYFTIEAVLPSLGEDGMKRVQDLIRELYNAELIELQQTPDIASWKVKAHRTSSPAGRALRTIAELRNDVDTYIEFHDESHVNPAGTAIDIGKVMVRAGRHKDAIKLVEDELKKERTLIDEQILDMKDILITACESLKMHERAQELRLEIFHQFLSHKHLQDYLKKLPDFEDFEALDKALNFVEAFPDLKDRIKFLLDFKKLDKVNELVLAEHKTLNGSDDLFLERVALRLADQFPLAATILYRKIIEYLLNRRSAYKERSTIKEFLKVCKDLSKDVDNFGVHGDHETYLENKIRSHYVGEKLV